jgi:DNA polymerase III delta prime subunit
LCWLVDSFPKQGAVNRVTVQVHTFNMKYQLPDMVNVGITDIILVDIRTRFLPSARDTEAILEWLSEETLINSVQVQRIAISAGQSFSPDITSFRIHGRRVALDVQRGAEHGYEVTRVVSSRGRDADGQPVWLLEGHFRFLDASAVGQYNETGGTLVDEIVRRADSYLKIWDEYNELERESIERRIREFGAFRYTECERLPDGQWRFRVDRKSWARLGSLEDGVAVDLEAAEHLSSAFRDGDPKDTSKREAEHGSRFIGTCTGVYVERGELDLQPQDVEEGGAPAEKGFLFIPDVGDKIRLRRRSAARNRIASSLSPIPWLALFIENQPVPTRQRRKIRPQKSKVQDLFGGDPLPRQMEALEVALNTPDIALIQGPPGTGKTRVIAALERTLAGESQGRQVAGRILLSSYQHDAVENAADCTLVLGLPAVKIGRQRGRAQDHALTFDNVQMWRDARIQELDKQLKVSETPVETIARNIRRLIVDYLQRPPHFESTLGLLQEVYQESLGWVSPELSEELERALRGFQQQQDARKLYDEDRELLLAAVRGLRTSAVAFMDDGPRMAYKLCRRLDGLALLSEVQLACLQRAAEWPGDEPQFLTELKAIQEELIDRLTSELKLEQSASLNSELYSCLSRVSRELYRLARESRSGVEVALEDYLDDLRNDPQGVKSALQTYTGVLAATCQQAVSRPMLRFKDLDLITGDEGLNFDTVIVDEAARANPLDLLIPMSLAKDRIILVGDHRQLPHILEPDVERELNISEKNTQEALEKSLFERLFKHARKLEERDGVRRTVTLNAQFRMHPVLGAFVSDTFYGPYGEGFDSPTAMNVFKHDISPYEGKVAAWVDVPIASGEECRGRSKSRPVEAKWIAAEAKRILDQHTTLSVGVITFYGAQQDLIFHELSKLGVVDPDESGFTIAPSYRETRDEAHHLIERLRVGTVDAFQGKEFDVVLLSTTRSNRRRFTLEDESSLLSKYGFLTLENRLCVAMSRQKRLLIVVGDAEMVNVPDAKEAVPGLAAFYEFCRSEHGIIRPFHS